MTAQPVHYIDLAEGTPTYGLWCPHCLLPSVVETPIHALRDDGPHQFGAHRACRQCGNTVPATPA